MFNPIWFSNRRDKTLTIGVSSGLLKYPNRDQPPLYEDGISTRGSSEHRPVKLRLLLNIGDLYSLLRQASALDYILDHKGSSDDGQGRFEITIYKDGLDLAIGTFTHLVDEKALAMGIGAVGESERMLLEFTIPTEQLLNVRDLLLSTFALRYVRHPRPGVQ